MRAVAVPGWSLVVTTHPEGLAVSVPQAAVGDAGVDAHAFVLPEERWPGCVVGGRAADKGGEGEPAGLATQGPTGCWVEPRARRIKDRLPPIGG